MGFSRVVRAVGAFALIAVASRAHAAGRFTLDDGLAVGTDGHLVIPVDDYGSWGRAFPNSVDDSFKPPGVAESYPTYLAGAFMFVTNGTGTSSILFSEYNLWAGFLEAPPNEDGLLGMHANLARTISTGITGSGNTATSSFDVTATGLAIHVDLVQKITTNVANATSVFSQVYKFRNDGPGALDLVFHAAWEPDLYYESGPSNGYANDVVGVVAGQCAVYVHNPNSSTVAVALASGPGTTLTTPPYYYGGKKDDVPPMGSTPFQPLSAADNMQYIWLQHGMPPSWRNYATGAGYNAEGNSGTLLADATMGMEWHFTLAAGGTETIDVRRYYGTIAVPCGVPKSCGNGNVDAGEACDGADTATCNGGTCLPSVCGDGYWNQTANEECESGGVNSDTCNGMLCTTPVCGDGYWNAAAGELCDEGAESAACNANCTPTACGDGYVNVAADEECDGGELCDAATCKVNFTVGGGCAGCGARGAAPGSAWLALAVLLSARRRRRARRG